MKVKKYNIFQRLAFKPERDRSNTLLAELKLEYDKYLEGEVVLLFPNDTKVKITGDVEVLKQIIDRLNGLVVKYRKPNERQL